MKVVHVHRVRGVGGSERHLLTLLPALRERGIDARFLGLDDGDPGSVLRAARPRSACPTIGSRAPRDLDPALLARSARLARRLAARHRPHPSRPRRRLRRRSLRGLRADARQHEAQRRSVPARALPPCRAARSRAAPRGSSASRTRWRASTSSEVGLPAAKLTVDPLRPRRAARCVGAAGWPDLPETRRCSSRSRGSSARRGSTSRSRRWPGSGPPAHRRRC